MEKEFVIVTWDAEGKIDAAAMFRSLAHDAFKAGKNRALIAGSKTFQVFQIKHEAGGSLSFSRVEKAESGEAGGEAPKSGKSARGKKGS